MKIKNIIATLVALVLFAAIFAACVFPVNSFNANIESVKIQAHGFDESPSTISVSKEDLEDEDYSISVSVKITWQDNTSGSKKLNVWWEFIGDDLGCEVIIIDPCCTNGTIAIVRLGDKTGEVTLRATAQSENSVSADLDILIGQEDGQSKIGGLYKLQEAYGLGFLTSEDIFDIVLFHQGQPPYISTLWYPHTPKNPEFLSVETETKIKQTFLDDYSYEGDYPIEYTLNDITITKYCGTYHGAVAVMIDGLYGYDGGFTSETVAGITINYSNGNYLRVWVEEEYHNTIMDKPTAYFLSASHIENSADLPEAELIYSRQELEKYTWYTRTGWSGNGDTVYNQDSLEILTRYTDSFFDSRQLIAVCFSAGSGGDRYELTKIEYQDGAFIVYIKHVAHGMTDDMRYWLLLVELENLYPADTKIITSNA